MASSSSAVLFGIAVHLSFLWADDVHPMVIIDCDPAGLIWTGFDVDDDLALIAAIALNASGKLSLAGITTVGGNAPQYQAHSDIRTLRTWLQLELQVHPGAGWWPPPWDRYPDADMWYEPTAAASFIINTVMKAPPRSVTLLCLGPLTNVAAAFQQRPGVAARVQQVVILGGQLHSGPLDFNSKFDRASMQRVLAAPVPKLMMPVRVATQVALGQAGLRQLLLPCANTNYSAAVCLYSGRLRMHSTLAPWLINGKFRATSPYPEVPGGHAACSSALIDGFVLWDVAALFLFSHPALFFGWRHYQVELRGWEMDATELSARGSDVDNHTGVVQAPVAADEAAIIQLLGQLLHAPAAALQSPPRIPHEFALMGFVPHMVGLLFGLVLFCGMSQQLWGSSAEAEDTRCGDEDRGRPVARGSDEVTLRRVPAPRAIALMVAGGCVDVLWLRNSPGCGRSGPILVLCELQADADSGSDERTGLDGLGMDQLDGPTLNASQSAQPARQRGTETASSEDGAKESNGEVTDASAARQRQQRRQRIARRYAYRPPPPPSPHIHTHVSPAPSLRLNTC
jgi:inosine-uridine nucleoside N-ribohydrolase